LRFLVDLYALAGRLDTLALRNELVDSVDRIYRDDDLLVSGLDLVSAFSKLPEDCMLCKLLIHRAAWRGEPTDHPSSAQLPPQVLVKLYCEARKADVEHDHGGREPFDANFSNNYHEHCDDEVKKACPKAKRY